MLVINDHQVPVIMSSVVDVHCQIQDVMKYKTSLIDKRAYLFSVFLRPAKHLFRLFCFGFYYEKGPMIALDESMKYRIARLLEHDHL